jgi:hypothetical protein
VRCIVASKGSVTDECKVVRGILSVFVVPAAAKNKF